MADLVNRAQMRKELPRLSGQAFIQSQEVLTSSFRRIGAGDYRLAIDDVALLAAINSFATQEKAEDDETQTKLDTINASLGTINTSITTLNANLTTLLNEVKTALGGIDASIDETTAAVNDVNEDTESIDAKMDTANTHLAKLDPIQSDVEIIRDNTTPVPVSVELVGLEGMPNFKVRDNGMGGKDVSCSIIPGDLTHRGWRGNLVYNNGKREPLSAKDFSSDKFYIDRAERNQLQFDSNGDVYVDICSGDYTYAGGTIIYTYADGITTKVDISVARPTSPGVNVSNFVQGGIDLAHIQVGQTIDFTAANLTCTVTDPEIGSYEATWATTSAACQDPVDAYVVSWESSSPDVLAPIDDQPGKFNAIKAGTSTITYKFGDKTEPDHATATFNAVVEGE